MSLDPHSAMEYILHYISNGAQKADHNNFVTPILLVTGPSHFLFLPTLSAPANKLADPSLDQAIRNHTLPTKVPPLLLGNPIHPVIANKCWKLILENISSFTIVSNWGLNFLNLREA